MKPFLLAPLAIARLLFIETSAASQTNWATSIRLPAAERKTKASLFNGKDLRYAADSREVREMIGFRSMAGLQA